jgi:hypothetical protein
MPTTESLTDFQILQRAFFALIDKAGANLDPDDLDALRTIVKYRIDRIADTALGEF